jgi:hypothetical protein
MRHAVKIKKQSEGEAALKGFTGLWKAVKVETGTSQRNPKLLVLTDEPQDLYLDDGYVGKRWGLNLSTMELTQSLHISSGEWACHAGSNNDRAVTNIPVGYANVTAVWSDHHRSFELTVQVALGRLLPQRSVQGYRIMID